ncbi:S24 family peptidase [Dolosigranulum savutiense]|uniref:S24 family peptidase n=1 Tax=Dolosigranulum savutiense TaxID=3110288 RepID=A0AB74TWU6_9LACT
MSLENHLKEMIIQKAGNLKEFSRVANIPYTTVRSILERGVMNAKTQNILDMCDALGITPETLLEMDNGIVSDIVNTVSQLNPHRQTKVYNFATDQLNEQRVEETPAIYHTVQVYSLLSAGTGIVDLDPTDTTEIELNGHVPPHDLAFEVRGDSMEPVFENGEIVFVKKTQDIHNGQIIAVQINEEAYIKKVYITNDHMRLVSLNKEYEDIIANENDDIRIVGKVLI